jgi:site-specific DNA-adenine methylase
MPIRIGEPDPIARLGGKAQIIEKICEIAELAIQNHNLVGVADLFMGGCRLFLHLDCDYTVNFKIASEIDRGLVQFFKYLQDPYKTDELIDHICLTADDITTKEEFEEANLRRLEDETMSELELASLSYIISIYSMAADMQNFSQADADRGIDPATLDKLLDLEEYLADVEFVVGNYLDTWKKFIYRDDILTWLDPPYVRDVKDGKGRRKKAKVEPTRRYIHPFTPEDQETLIDHAIKSKNKIIISGYDNVAYKRLEKNGFDKHFIGLVNVYSGSSGEVAKEFVWVNFDIDVDLLPEEPSDDELKERYLVSK